MSEGFIGQIIMFGGNFAPRSWSLCQGQLLPISSNTALFSILGTIYGGDGRTTFALPDCRGRRTIQEGTGPGLPTYRLGQKGGNYQATLSTINLPSHNHTATGEVKASRDPSDTRNPNGNYIGAANNTTTPAEVINTFATTANAEVAMHASTVGVTVNNNGGNQPFNIEAPYIAVNYIIAIFGTFPSRS